MVQNPHPQLGRSNRRRAPITEAAKPFRSSSAGGGGQVGSCGVNAWSCGVYPKAVVVGPSPVIKQPHSMVPCVDHLVDHGDSGDV